MLATLLYSIAGGMFAVLATARVEQIAWRFLRFVGLLALVMFVSVSLWVWAEDTTRTSHLGWYCVAGFAASLGAGAFAVVTPFARRRPGVIRLAAGIIGSGGLLAACGAALGVLRHRFAGVPEHRLAELLTVLGQLTSAFVLGSITIAWLLGHAYLTATKMSIAPLRHFSRMLNWSVAAKLLFVFASLLVGWWMTRSAGSDAPTASPSILTLVQQSWLVAILRGTLGLLSLAVFAYMVTDCVRLRSTQSATGILYFASVFAYVGELASQQLLKECGWPI